MQCKARCTVSGRSCKARAWNLQSFLVVMISSIFTSYHNIISEYFSDIFAGSSSFIKFYQLLPRFVSCAHQSSTIFQPFRSIFISFLCKGVFNMTSGVGWIPWQRVDLIHLTLATVQDKDMMSRIARLIACGLSRDASCHGTVNRGLVANKEVLRPFWILFWWGRKMS